MREKPGEARIIWAGLRYNPDYTTYMDIQELTAEMHRFVESQGWYKTNSKRQQTPRNLAISLCLESAEVLEHFQWKDEPTNSEELASELADVTLYLLQIASITNIDLEKAVLEKLRTNYQRTWDSDIPPDNS